MEQRPLPDTAFTAPDAVEPRLELVPALDDPETVDIDAVDEPVAVDDEAEADAEAPAESTEAEELEALESAVQAQDPLKLYVRSIGGGPLLTRAEERDLAVERVERVALDLAGDVMAGDLRARDAADHGLVRTGLRPRTSVMS